MKKYIKYFLVAALIILVLMQFYRPARNLYSGPVLPSDITNVYHVPVKVQTILQVSCNDCHSNNTHYPWYSEIQPIRMFEDSHINEGKEELNFSEFGNYTKKRQERKLKSMAEEIKEDEMPLASYTLIHRDAKLSAENKKILLDWIVKIQDSIAGGK